MAAIGPRWPKSDSCNSVYFQSCSEEVQNVAGSGFPNRSRFSWRSRKLPSTSAFSCRPALTGKRFRSKFAIVFSRGSPDSRNSVAMRLPVLKATGVLSLQKLEDRLGFKPGIVFKQLLHIVPDIDERIRPCPTTHRRRQLAWQPAQAPVLPPRLRVHPRLGRRNLLAFLCLYQRKQPPNLLVGDQSASVPMNRNTLGLIVVASGVLFVVDR